MTYTSPERVYLDKDGNVVPEDSPAAATLLVGAGGTLPDAQARKLGLIKAETKDEPETKAVESPPANKAVTRSPQTKARKA